MSKQPMTLEEGELRNEWSYKLDNLEWISTKDANSIFDFFYSKILAREEEIRELREQIVNFEKGMNIEIQRLNAMVKAGEDVQQALMYGVNVSNAIEAYNKLKSEP